MAYRHARFVGASGCDFGNLDAPCSYSHDNKPPKAKKRVKNRRLKTLRKEVIAALPQVASEKTLKSVLQPFSKRPQTTYRAVSNSCFILGIKDVPQKLHIWRNGNAIHVAVYQGNVCISERVFVIAGKALTELKKDSAAKQPRSPEPGSMELVGLPEKKSAVNQEAKASGEEGKESYSEVRQEEPRKKPRHTPYNELFPKKQVANRQKQTAPHPASSAAGSGNPMLPQVKGCNTCAKSLNDTCNRGMTELCEDWVQGKTKEEWWPDATEEHGSYPGRSKTSFSSEARVRSGKKDAARNDPVKPKSNGKTDKQKGSLRPKPSSKTRSSDMAVSRKNATRAVATIVEGNTRTVVFDTSFDWVVKELEKRHLRYKDVRNRETKSGSLWILEDAAVFEKHLSDFAKMGALFQVAENGSRIAGPGRKYYLKGHPEKRKSR